jgi:hypothetical protein
MQLEHICDMELVYREESLYNGKFLLTKPYGSEEGTGYGEGDGTVTGVRLTGKVRWVNHPHRRSDGMMLPDFHGVIVTDDQTHVMMAVQGRTFFENDTGKQLLTIIFEAEDARYQWLNKTICVAEGLISAERLSMQARVFACVHELV